MNKTQQQIDIINAAKTNANLVIKAFAGCGKTSTLTMVAEERQFSSLYVAFNKSIATEAASKFPSHVECKTINSLAWKAVVKYTKSPYGNKLQGFFDFNDVEDGVGIKEDEQIRYKISVMTLVTKFCQSDYPTIQDLVKGESYTAEYPNTIKAAIELWAKVSDSKSPAKMTHDVYLKLFQLSKPVLNYNVIYLDEAQDSNPVTLDIILRQRHAQIIIVGDSYQSIYEWRGAINALDRLPASFKELYLSESFRFNADIADIATRITRIAGNTIPVIGKAAKKQEINSRAILVRTNVSLLDTLMASFRESKKVYVLADLTDLWKKVYHISSLKYGSEPRYPDKELSVYKSAKDLFKAAEELPELRKLLNIVDVLEEGGLTTNINNIKSVIVDSQDKADFTIATIHKSKGLEWDSVVIADDFLHQNESQELKEAIHANQFLNCFYVAVTRAKQFIQLPVTGEYIVENYMEFVE